MFTVRNLSKEYQSGYALDDVSLSINSGMNFIIGASGSGKSTLLKIMSGMEQGYTGDVYINNKNLKEITDKSGLYNSVIGFVWQDFNLLEELSVYENLLVTEPNTQSLAATALRDSTDLDVLLQRLV